MEITKQKLTGFSKKNKRILLISFGVSLVVNVIAAALFYLVPVEPTLSSELGFGAGLFILFQFPGIVITQFLVMPFFVIIAAGNPEAGQGDVILQIMLLVTLLLNIFIYGVVLTGVLALVRKLRRK